MRNLEDGMCLMIQICHVHCINSECFLFRFVSLPTFNVVAENFDEKLRSILAAEDKFLAGQKMY